MKVLFVIEAYFEWIGVRYLSALLKKEGNECDVLIESSIEKIARYVKKEQPNLVGYVTLSGLHKFCIASASEIKEVSPETKIIFGGPHATFFPKVIESDPVDYVCQGEGEIPFMELVHRMKSNGSTTDIPGIWAKQEGKIYQNPPKLLIDDLDTLPLPDDEIFEKYDVFRKSYSWATMAGRGCPYNCSFCFNRQLKDLYENKASFVRFRSAEIVIKEILQAKSKYPNKKYVHFHDDTFCIDKRWFLDFAHKYAKQVGMPYFAQIRANVVDEDVAAALKESGCRLAGWGIESGVENIRRNILKKTISDERIIETGKLLNKYKIPFLTTNMLALPTETFEDGLETIRLNQKIGTSVPWYSVFQPYPGTDIVDDMRDLLQIPVFQDNFDFDFHSKSIIKNKDAKKLAKLHKFSVLLTKFPRLLPIVKFLILFPDNALYRIVHRMSHTWVYSKVNMNGYINTVLLGLKYEWLRLKFLFLYKKKSP